MEKPLHWKKPRMVFVGSMTDLFREQVQLHASWIGRIMDVIEACPQHRRVEPAPGS